MKKLLDALSKNEQNLRPITLVALLYLIPAVQALLPIDDPDVWWRLRTGQWIIENHSPPARDYFSTLAMGKPWIEYSWLSEVLIYVTYALLGLLGVVYFVLAMALLIAAAAHLLVRRCGLPLAAEIGLVGAALGAMKPLMTPRPWLFTILLFCIELFIIDRARHSGKPRLLWTLPLLFVLWANLHIQFIYGLAVLGLLLAEAVIVFLFQRRGIRVEVPTLSPGHLTMVLLACIAATFATPYYYLLYVQIAEYIGQTSVFLNIAELHPNYFRSPDSWLILLLTVATAFILGWRRKWLPFPTLLFLLATFAAFRARRDVWFLALTAIWIIGDCRRALWPKDSFNFTKTQLAVSAVVVAVVAVLVSIGRQITHAGLQAVVEQRFPVRAVNYVNAKRLPGPLFNDYEWGGFLLWSLPRLPVAIDGRLNLFGEEQLEQSIQTWNGYPGWNYHPDLVGAKLIIANKERPLVSLLRFDQQFKLAYEDPIAVVFVANE